MFIINLALNQIYTSKESLKSRQGNNLLPQASTTFLRKVFRTVSHFRSFKKLKMQYSFYFPSRGVLAIILTMEDGNHLTNIAEH